MLLMVMMVVTLMPNTGWAGKAYAASSDPLQQVTVGYVDSEGWGNDVWLTASEPYYVNGATEATSDSTVDWNAYYDVSSGTLTYRNYDGNGVDVRTGEGWLKIVLIGDNKIHCKGQFGINVPNDLGISSEEGGTLSIDIGRAANCYGICSENGGIQLTGDAEISVKVTSEGTSNNAYCVEAKSGRVWIMDDVKLDMEAIATGSYSGAIGISAGIALRVETPNMITFRGTCANNYAYVLKNFSTVSFVNGAKMSIEVTGDSENSIYWTIDTLRTMLANCGYRVKTSVKDGIVTGMIEPKTQAPNPINITYDDEILPGLTVLMTGEEAYELFKEAVTSPTEENYLEQDKGWYVDMSHEFSGISNDTGDGGNLNTSTESFEYGTDYYVMFCVKIDEDNYYMNINQEFTINGSDDYIVGEGIDEEGRYIYSVSRQVYGSYGPNKEIGVYSYNTTNQQGDMVSVDGSEYDGGFFDYIGQGKTITLDAKAGEGNEFLEWRKGESDGETISTDATINVTVTEDMDYYAVFQKELPAHGVLSDTVEYDFDKATGTVTLIPVGDDGEGGKTGKVGNEYFYGGTPFYNNVKIKDVVIQEGITELGDNIFSYNTISSVSIPASLEALGFYDTFDDCIMAGDGFTVADGNEVFSEIDGSLVRDGTRLVKFVKKPGQTEYAIPDGITYICWQCFQNVELEKLTLRGDGLGLSNYAIRDSIIEHLVIEEGVTDLGDFSSFECKDTGREFPLTLEYAGQQNSFIDNEEIVWFSVPYQSQYYESNDGVLYAKKDNGLEVYKYPNGKENETYTVPEGVVSINNYRAIENKYLKKIELPEDVSYVCYGGFNMLNGVTIVVYNPECEFNGNAVYYCNNITMMGYLGSTTQMYAKSNGSITFVPMGENNGKLPAPANAHWEGTVAKWDPVDGARYEAVLYRYNRDLEEWTKWSTVEVEAGVTEQSFASMLWYADEEYYFTVTAYKVTYEESDAARSGETNGVLPRTNEHPVIEGDTLVFPVPKVEDIDGLKYYTTVFQVYDSSDNCLYNHWFGVENDGTMNLREYLKDHPYGTYKIYTRLYGQYYDYQLEMVEPPEDTFVYYEYKEIPAISKVELTIPDPVNGEKAHEPEGFGITTWCGEVKNDGYERDSSVYRNCFMYRDSEDGGWSHFDSDTVVKGKYQYSYYIELEKRYGYDKAENVEVFVNGSKTNVEIEYESESYLHVRYTYPVGTQPADLVDTVNITIDMDALEVFNTKNTAGDVFALLNGKSGIVDVDSTGVYSSKGGNDIVFSNEYGWNHCDPAEQLSADKEYGIYVNVIALEDGYAFAYPVRSADNTLSSDIPGFTTKVNGTVRDDVILYYNKNYSSYGPVLCAYVPIGKPKSDTEPGPGPDDPPGPGPDDPTPTPVTGVTRYFGATRYQTAIKAADAYKAQLGIDKFDSVIIACGTNYADALAGSYLSSVKKAPILLVRNTADEIKLVQDYIKANLKSGGMIYMLGGEAVVPEAAITGLSGFKSKRLWGTDRYATNVEILKEAGVSGDEILVASGTGFADSLSASATGKPILLVKNAIQPSQKAFIESLMGKKFYMIGGTGAVSKDIETYFKGLGTVTRIDGATRYDTSANVAKTFFSEPKGAVIAYGANFPDGLCGGSLANAMGGPLLLSANNKSAQAAAYAKANGIKGGAVLGGPTLISDDDAKTIFSMPSGTMIKVIS